MSWWSRFVIKDSLGGIKTATRVALEGTIGSDGQVDSFLTGFRAAYFQYRFSREVLSNKNNYANNVVYRDLGTTSCGTSLRLERSDGVVELDVARIKVEFEGADGPGVLLDKPLPESMREFSQRVGYGGQLFVQEMYLGVGEKVSLEGFLEPAAARADAGPFREPPKDPRPRFTLRPDLGPVRLIQRFRLG